MLLEINKAGNTKKVEFAKHWKSISYCIENLSLENLYKNSDITYDVHFNYLKDCFLNNGLNDVKFNTQLKALVEYGILDLLEILKANVQENVYLKETQKVKMLLEPTGMGDRFKVINVRKQS